MKKFPGYQRARNCLLNCGPTEFQSASQPASRRRSSSHRAKDATPARTAANRTGATTIATAPRNHTARLLTGGPAHRPEPSTQIWTRLPALVPVGTEITPPRVCPAGDVHLARVHEPLVS